MKKFEFKIPLNQPTANGRVYPPEVLKKAVAKAQSRIKAGTFVGEIDPPGDGKTRLRDVSHRVTTMRVDDQGRIVGDVEVLDTAAGKMLESMLQGGVEMYITTKGTGAVDDNGVVSDFKLLSVPFAMGPRPWESVVDKLGQIVDKTDEDSDDD